MNSEEKKFYGILDSVEGGTIIVKIDQIVDDLLSDPIKMSGYLISLDLYYFGKNGPGKKWKNLADAKNDKDKASLPEEIAVEKVITSSGVKYKVVYGIRSVVLAIQRGLSDVPALEIIRTKVKQN